MTPVFLRTLTNQGTIPRKSSTHSSFRWTDVTGVLIITPSSRNASLFNTRPKAFSRGRRLGETTVVTTSTTGTTAEKSALPTWV